LEEIKAREVNALVRYQERCKNELPLLTQTKFEGNIPEELIPFAGTLKTLVFEAARKAQEEFFESSKEACFPTAARDLGNPKIEVFSQVKSTPCIQCASTPDQRHLTSSPHNRVLSSDSGYASDHVRGEGPKTAQAQPLDSNAASNAQPGPSVLNDFDPIWQFPNGDIYNNSAGLDPTFNTQKSTSFLEPPAQHTSGILCFPEYDNAVPPHIYTPPTYSSNEASFLDDAPAFPEKYPPSGNQPWAWT
jgi:hypothetical protein